MKWLDVAFKILAGAVLPLMLWGFKLELRVALLEADKAQAEKASASLEKLTESVNDSKVLLGQMVVDLRNANKQLDQLTLARGRTLPPP